MKRVLALLTALSLPAEVFAQETVDLGTLRNEEIQVVQKVLYPKDGRSELSFAVGAIAFDPYMFAPKIQIGYGKHLSEKMSWEAQVGAGYGLGTQAFRQQSEPAYGRAPEAYRYLASVTGGITWSPIYAKFNLLGNRVFHHDVYIPVVGGVTLEQLAWGEKYLAVSPTVGVGVGVRVFQGDGKVIRLELRDDVLLQNRKQSDRMYIKQNVGIHLGFSMLGDRS